MPAEILLPLLGLLLCVVLGSNNASVCLGPSSGARIAKYSFVAWIAAFGTFFGMIMEGSKMSRTVVGGMLAGTSFEVILIILLTNVSVLVAATLFSLPLSLSHSVVGAAVGAGLGAGTPVNWDFTLVVVISWAIAPLFATFVSILAFKVVSYINRSIKNLLRLNYIYGKLTLILSLYISYVLGANTVGLVNGLFDAYLGKQLIFSLVFGLASAFGIVFLGRRLTEVVSTGIVGLGSSTALVAQFSSALAVHVFTQFALPVSITQVLIGGIFGISLAKRLALVNLRRMVGLVVGWLLAPVISFMVSYLLIVNII